MLPGPAGHVRAPLALARLPDHMGVGPCSCLKDIGCAHCRNSFDGDNATYWSYPFNKLYKRVGAPDVTLGVDSVGNLLQTGERRSGDMAVIEDLHVVWNATLASVKGMWD